MGTKIENFRLISYLKKKETWYGTGTEPTPKEEITKIMLKKSSKTQVVFETNFSHLFLRI